MTRHDKLSDNDLRRLANGSTSRDTSTLASCLAAIIVLGFALTAMIVSGVVLVRLLT